MSQNSGKIAEKLAEKDQRIHVVYHKKNGGVGAAVISGYKKALELNANYIVKMDGDGQMDPTFIEKLLQPLKKNKADYTKGNRFKEPAYLKNMPRIRLLGKSILSFLLKVCSGYWNVMDPTNGFTAIRSDMLRKFNF